MKWILRLAAVLFAAAVCAAPAGASNLLTGFVMFSNGASAPGAHVSIHNVTTGAWGSTYASSNGQYLFSSLVYAYTYDVFAYGTYGCYQYTSPTWRFTSWTNQYKDLYFNSQSRVC